MRLIVLAAAALLLAALIPDDDPGAWLTAAFSAAAVLTVVTAIRTVTLACAFLLRYSLPVAFVGAMVEHVEDDLAAGVPRLARWKVQMFEQMIKLAFRRGDSAAVTAGLGGLEDMLYAYVRTAPGRSDVRDLDLDEYDPPRRLTGWFGIDLAGALTRLAEDGFRLQAPSFDVDDTIALFESAGHEFITAGLVDEARQILDGATFTGCSSHQVGAGYVNFQSRPAGVIARLMRAAAEAGYGDLAARALANWMLVVSYAHEHFRDLDAPIGQHPNWRSGLQDFGEDPPWEAAAGIIESSDWQRKWTNQMNFGVGFVAVHLLVAREEHAAMQRGEEPAPNPSPNDVAAMMTGEPPDKPTPEPC